MFRSIVLIAVMAFAMSASIAVGAVRANALVGSTMLFALPATVAPAPDDLRALFRRPESVPFPDNNPYTPEKALLGQMLFHDTRLSANGTLSCASCHNAALGYGDGLAKAVGQGGKALKRRSPSIVNAAWDDRVMWDGSAESLEAQALFPISAQDEMDQPADRLLHTLGNIADYKPMFASAFPNSGVTLPNVAAALATYERTIVSRPAPFDAWIDGDESALPAAARRGFALFDTKARCALCHSGWNFTDNGFHDVGLADADLGRGRQMPRVIKMQHAFKTPSLRDVAQRGPFMHDGSLPSLAAVVAFYNAGGVRRASQSELVGPLHLSEEEQTDIVAFLQAITSAAQRDVVAALPR